MQQLFLEVSKVFAQISLSVSESSSALKFFEQLGFEKLEGTEYDNGVSGISFKMLKKLGEFQELKEEKHLEEECFKKSFRAQT
jgi:adenylate cyclase class IV